MRERPFRMRVQVVADEDHLVALPVTTIEQPGHFECPIHLRLRLPRRCHPPSREGFGEHENLRGARPLVLVIDAPGMLRGGRDGLSGLLDQLHGLLVHTEHRARWIIRFCVGFQHLLHVGHEFGIGFRRNDPVFDLAIRHSVFLACAAPFRN